MAQGENVGRLFFPPNVLPTGLLKVNLINLDVCSNAEHKHFDTYELSTYPDPAVAYTETVPVAYPPLKELSYKRRSSVYVTSLKPPIPTAPPPPPLPPQQQQQEPAFVDDDDEAEEEENAGAGKRFKRAANEDTISVTAIAVTTTLQPNTKTEYSITNSTTMQELVESLDGMIVDALSYYTHCLKVRPTLRLANMTAEEIASNAGSTEAYKWVELVLPKGFSLAFPELETWKMLGFTQPNIVTTLAARQLPKVIANTQDDATIAEKTLTVRSAMPLLPTATVESLFIGYRTLIHKERLLPENLRKVQLALEWSPLNKIRFKITFPRDRIRYQGSPTYLALTLKNIVDLICEIFGFDVDNFVQIEKLGNKIVMAALSNDPASPEFKIKIAFQDLEYAKYWGLNTTQINYSSRDTTQFEFAAIPPGLEDPHAALGEEQAIAVDSEVDKLLGNISSVLDWPNNKIPIAIGVRQDLYKDWTEAMTERAERERKNKEKEEEEEKKRKKAAADAKAEEEKKVKEEEEKRKKKEQEERQRHLPEQAAAEPPPAAAAVEPVQVVPPVGIEVRQEQQQQPPAHLPVVAPPRIIEEANPQVKPPTTFVSWPPPAVIQRCEAPAGFPEKYHILLLQGEPSDYIIEHGQVCILGYINKTTVSSKGCVLVNNQIERVLDVQFLSKSLLLYTHPKTNPLDAKKDAFLRATLNIKQVRKIK